MRFVGALDTILRLAAAWKLFDHFENAAWHIPAECRPEDNNISNLEFVERHRFLAFPGRITVGSHLNSVDVSLTGARPAERSTRRRKRRTGTCHQHHVRGFADDQFPIARTRAASRLVRRSGADIADCSRTRFRHATANKYQEERLSIVKETLASWLFIVALVGEQKRRQFFVRLRTVGAALWLLARRLNSHRCPTAAPRPWCLWACFRRGPSPPG
jgi:hypothetical protein